jgi:hypothetical protein
MMCLPILSVRVGGAGKQLVPLNKARKGEPEKGPAWGSDLCIHAARLLCLRHGVAAALSVSYVVCLGTGHSTCM